MVYHGRVQNGQVVLDPPQRLPEGVEVSVEVIETQAAVVPSTSPLMRYAGRAEDLPEDASESIDSVLYRRDLR